jgi:hypothetical protein
VGTARELAAAPFTYYTRRTPRARPFSASLTPPTDIKDSRARTTSDANVYREPDPRRSRSFTDHHWYSGTGTGTHALPGYSTVH